MCLSILEQCVQSESAAFPFTPRRLALDLLFNTNPRRTPCSQDAQEHVLSEQSLQHGYKDSLEALGISEAKEVELSLAHRADLWEGPRLVALQKVRHRAAARPQHASGSFLIGGTCMLQAAWRQLHEVCMEQERGAPGAAGSLQQHALVVGGRLPALAGSSHVQQDDEAQRQWMQVRLR